MRINASLYHFLCGVCAGVFIVLMLDYGWAMLWFWSAAAASATALSILGRPCWDVDEIKRELRKRGYIIR